MVFLASSCGAIDNKLTNATVLTLRSTGRPVSGTLRIGMAAQAPVSFTLKVSCGSPAADLHFEKQSLETETLIFSLADCD